MKSNHITTFGSLLFAIFLNSTVFSQPVAVAISGVRNPGGQVFIKTEIPNSAIKPVNTVSTKVARSFLKNFQDAKNLYWMENSSEYIAEFAFNGRQVLAWFTKSGVLHCANYYGSEKHLPTEYREMLQSSYKDQAITATAEIKCKSGEAWIVTLQNCISMRKIRFIDGNMEEIEYLKKQP